MSDTEVTPNVIGADPRTAPSPFDRTTTDIILRSSDNVDFNVFSQILIAASPFFETMFELPQPSPSPSRGQAQPKYGKPIVQVSENSMTLETLLRICYPIVQRDVETLEEVESSLRAAMKFEMELPIAVLTDRLEALTYRLPLQAWAVACRLNLEDVAKLAASQLSLCDLENCTPQLLEGVPAGHYYRLHRYLSITPIPESYQLLTPPSSCPTAPSESIDSLLPSPYTVVEVPTPDIVCRSSDDVDFHAHRTVLLLSSSVLSQMIATGDDRSPIRFEEHSRVLRPLLESCYPMSDSVWPKIPSDPFEQMSLLAALEKYNITTHGHHTRTALEHIWEADTAPRNPMRAYCAAIRAGETCSAKVAAQYVLEMDPVETAYVPEMETMPAISYHRLLTYSDTCRRVAAEHCRDILDSLARLEPTRRPDTSPTHGTIRATSMQPAARKVVSWVAEAQAEPAAASQKTSPPLLAWVLRRVEELVSDVERRPTGWSLACNIHVATLFVEATRAEERVWCCRCQVIAEALSLVRDWSNRLDATIDNVRASFH
ncbi:hypothetical protein C8Q80DRAFT_244238 [Daedaleopsis nitida]|nr:hypothetical protein C8Q80DRAFT_244238 [Daedaleopsis nitida]